MEITLITLKSITINANLRSFPNGDMTVTELLLPPPPFSSEALYLTLSLLSRYKVWYYIGG